MFSRFFSSRSGATDDLAEYRARYPKSAPREDRNACDNIKFYRNEIPGTDGVKIDLFHERIFGKYSALESGHSYIQWLFPIREQSMFNSDSQPLMLHEIAAMKADPLVLRRVFVSLQLILDFYGFDIEIEAPHGFSASGSSASASSAAAAAPSSKAVSANAQRKSGDEDSGSGDEPVAKGATPRGGALVWQHPNFPWAQLPGLSVKVQRQADPKFKVHFRNLLQHGHNNLRITRILKFLGEVGLENCKIATLRALHREIFQTGTLEALGSSYLNYWAGTIYDDEERAKLMQK